MGFKDLALGGDSFIHVESGFYALLSHAFVQILPRSC